MVFTKPLCFQLAAVRVCTYVKYTLCTTRTIICPVIRLDFAGGYSLSAAFTSINFFHNLFPLSQLINKCMLAFVIKFSADVKQKIIYSFTLLLKYLILFMKSLSKIKLVLYSLAVRIIKIFLIFDGGFDCLTRGHHLYIIPHINTTEHFRER